MEEAEVGITFSLSKSRVKEKAQKKKEKVAVEKVESDEAALGGIRG